MKKDGPLKVAASVQAFVGLAAQLLDEPLRAFGFTHESSSSDQWLASRTYRCEDRYITIQVNTHWHDAPAHGNVILGVGKAEGPEGDWNSTALWRLIRENDPESQVGMYPLDGVTLTDFLTQAWEDVLEHGGHFLNGELTMFYRARNRMTAGREPYKVWSRGDPSDDAKRIVQESVELKERFSREETS